MKFLRRTPNAENERRDTPKADTRDFHRSPAEAVTCLLRCEGGRLRQFFHIHEMACGDGALVIPLRRAGFRVEASDLVARGCPASSTGDYLAKPLIHRRGVAGVTNPPFNAAEQFILRACQEFDYVAMLLRLRYLGSKHLVNIGQPEGPVERRPIWANTRIPFARVIVPNARWPMMHRDGYQGPKTESGMIDFGWFIWDAEHIGFPQVIMESQLMAAAAAGKVKHAHL